MSRNNLSQLEQKKRALEIELTRIQSDLDKSIDFVKEDVSNTFAPKSLIRRYPLPIVGAAFAIGILLGRGKKKSSGKSGKSSENSGISSVLGSEMKSALTKKGVHLLVNYLENNVFRIKGKNHE